MEKSINRKLCSILALLCVLTILLTALPVIPASALEIAATNMRLETETPAEGYTYSYRLNAANAYGGYYLYSTVENGGSADGAVRLSLGNAGTDLTIVDESERTVLSKNTLTREFTDPGTYRLTVRGNLENESGQPVTYSAPFTFTVGGEAEPVPLEAADGDAVSGGETPAPTSVIAAINDGTSYYAYISVDGQVAGGYVVTSHSLDRVSFSRDDKLTFSNIPEGMSVYLNGIALRSGSAVTIPGTHTLRLEYNNGTLYSAEKTITITDGTGAPTGSGTVSGGTSADLAGATRIRDTLRQSTYGSIYKLAFRSGAEDDYFFSTVRDGGIATEEVTLLFPEDWIVTTSSGRDFDTSRTTVSAEGTYNLMVYAPQADGSYLYDEFSFTIRYSTAAGSTGSTGSTGSSSSADRDDDEPQQVTLAQTAFEDFGLYEQKLDDTTFFYTSVANGGVIDGEVWLDIPQNIDFVLTRDGYEISYQSNQKLLDRGSYFLLVWSAKPISRKMQDYSDKRYGIFHFRIDRKIVSTPVTPTDDSTSSGELGYEALTPGTGGNGYIGTLTPSGTEGSAWETLPGDDQTGSGSMTEIDINPGDGSGHQTESGLMDAPVDRFQQTYLEDEGKYLQQNRAGSFYSSVPNGAVVNEAVVVELIGEQGVTVTKDDQPFEFHTGQQLTEDGVYRFRFGTEDFSGTPAVYQVRIITGPVNNLKVFTPPQDWSISQVLFNGEKLSVGKDWCRLEQDGHYTFTLDDAAAGTQRSLTITLDTTAPQLSLAGVENGVARGEVHVSSLSEDLASVTMYSNGELINTNPTLSEPAVYTLIACDQAGNTATYEFEIEYSMNTAAYLTIILIIAIAAAVVLFIIYNKRNAQVR